jgi:hypothetical protein
MKPIFCFTSLQAVLYSQSLVDIEGWNMNLFFAASLLALAITGAAQAADGSCRQEDIDVSTMPAVPQKANNLVTFRNKEKGMPGSADVVLVGDSIFAGLPKGSESAVFPGEKVFNWGVHSDRTQNVLWRFDNSKIAALKPSIVVLMIGVNNLSDATSGCGIAAGEIKIIDRLRAIWPESRLIVVSTMPYGPGYMDREKDRLTLNETVKGYVEKIPGSKVINLDESISCGLRHEPGYLETKFKFWPFLSHCASYQDDNVHMTSQGYEILSDALKQAYSGG